MFITWCVQYTVLFLAKYVFWCAGYYIYSFLRRSFVFRFAFFSCLLLLGWADCLLFVWFTFFVLRSGGGNANWFIGNGTLSSDTKVAVFIRHISCNPLITGIIRDVMCTILAYTNRRIQALITTIVSNRNIFNTGTTITKCFFIFPNPVAIARSFPDDGIQRRITTTITLTRSFLNGRIHHI